MDQCLKQQGWKVESKATSRWRSKANSPVRPEQISRRRQAMIPLPTVWSPSALDWPTLGERRQQCGDTVAWISSKSALSRQAGDETTLQTQRVDSCVIADVSVCFNLSKKKKTVYYDSKKCKQNIFHVLLKFHSLYMYMHIHAFKCLRWQLHIKWYQRKLGPFSDWDEIYVSILRRGYFILG